MQAHSIPGFPDRCTVEIYDRDGKCIVDDPYHFLDFAKLAFEHARDVQSFGRSRGNFNTAILTFIR
jgi:hypothetical protein